MENFQNENGPRLEKVWEPLLYSFALAIAVYYVTIIFRL